MTVYEIPLTATPQRFTVILGERELAITLRWKDVHEGGWSLDIRDKVKDEPLIGGVPLVAGVDLLGQYKYLGIPAKMFIDGDGMRDPTKDNLGTVVKLYVAMDDK